MKMFYYISNEYISVGVNSLGAELSELKDLDGTDYICPLGRLNWNGISPVLFPNTGAVFKNKAEIEGNMYPFSQHGFAKLSEFDLLDKSDNYLHFMLKSSEETLISYPYEFQLHITYRLIGRKLAVESEICNISDKRVMYCSLGFHPAFSCPIECDKQAEEYRLVFPNRMTASRMILTDGLISGIEEKYWENLDQIPIKEKMFDGGSFSMTDLSSKTVVLTSKDSGKYVRLDFSDFPNLIVWAPKYKPITNICIEPWYGRADSKEQKDIRFKPDTMKLLPGTTKRLNFTIELGNNK